MAINPENCEFKATLELKQPTIVLARPRSWFDSQGKNWKMYNYIIINIIILLTTNFALINSKCAAY